MGRSVLGSWIEAVDKYKEFVSLVKRMREAQKALYDIPYKTLGETELCQVRAWSLEKEVDDYLKKIETCD